MAVLPSDTLFILYMVGPKNFSLISPLPKCPSYATLSKNDSKKIKIIDQKPTKGRHFEVKHCTYNWEIGQKFDLIITFDLRTLLT